MPEFDRLYLDMNGIIHCSSHNNAEEEIEKPASLLLNIPNIDNNDDNNDSSSIADSNPPVINTTTQRGPPPITEEQIFQNVCYYLDRVISDIVQPKELVFLAIDGVAPRAKMNQQRGRRYRSGSEKEIEMHLMTLQRANQRQDYEDRLEGAVEADGGGDTGLWWEETERSSSGAGGEDSSSASSNLPRGAQRFSGTIETVTAGSSTGDKTDSSAEDVSSSLEEESYAFHSNAITPGTPFLHRCSKRIIEFVKK